MRGKAACVMLALAAAVVMAGCSSLGDVSLTPCDDEPDWVKRGSGEYGMAEERHIYGMGAAFPTEEQDAGPLAKQQARAELTRQVGGWTQAVNERMVDELSEYFENGEEAAPSFFAQATQEVPSAVAERGEVRSRWNCEVTGEAFCLMAVTEARAASVYKNHVAELVDEQGSDVLQIKPEEFVSFLRGKDLAESGPTGDLSN